MENLINGLSNNVIVKALIVALIFDIFLGSIRAIKEHKWNSTIGINGILRKVGMIGSILFLFITDIILKLDLVAFVPKEVIESIGIQTVGSCELFGIMFILYEVTSILKNMIKCDIPAPKWLKKKTEKILKDMTTELDDKKK